MHAALNVGVSRQEFIEIIIQMAAYAGVSACMNGLVVLHTVTLPAYADTESQGK